METDIYYGIYGGNLINSIYMLPNSAIIISFEENFHSQWIINMLHMNGHNPYIIQNETSKACPRGLNYNKCNTYFHNQNVYIDKRTLIQYIRLAQTDVYFRKYHIANYDIDEV